MSSCKEWGVMARRALSVYAGILVIFSITIIGLGAYITEQFKPAGSRGTGPAIWSIVCGVYTLFFSIYVYYSILSRNGPSSKPIFLSLVALDIACWIGSWASCSAWQAHYLALRSNPDQSIFDNLHLPKSM
jgi:hypothetical protein